MQNSWAGSAFKIQMNKITSYDGKSTVVGKIGLRFRTYDQVR